MNPHVVPRDDLIEHDASEDCACGPTPRIEKRSDGSDGWVVVHHSLDGREANERAAVTDTKENR